tara:strand:+ start:1692 stop:2201 length:510 start_codon:yes stop_codon:yes gene_type:complete
MKIVELTYPDKYPESSKAKCTHTINQPATGIFPAKKTTRSCRRVARMTVNGSPYCIQHAGEQALCHHLMVRQYNYIDIAGIDKAQLLIALYNKAIPVVPSYRKDTYVKEPLTVKEAQMYLDSTDGISFIREIPIETNLLGTSAVVDFYDARNGHHAFRSVVNEVKNANL